MSRRWGMLLVLGLFGALVVQYATARYLAQIDLVQAWAVRRAHLAVLLAGLHYLARLTAIIVGPAALAAIIALALWRRWSKEPRR